MPFYQATENVEFIVNGQKGTVLLPPPEIGINRLPGRKVARPSTPSTPFAQHLEDRIQDVP